MTAPPFTQPDPSATLLGCVLNPKTLRPSLVYATRHGRSRELILIADAAGMLVGSGSYAEARESDNESFLSQTDPGEGFLTAEETGFPRVAKVKVLEEYQGQGYATVLYTALVLGAWSNNTGKLAPGAGLAMNTEGSGISSNYNRPPEADVWWDRAKELGIAYEEEIEIAQEEQEFSVEISLRGEYRLRDALVEAIEYEEDIYGAQRVDDITVEGTTSSEAIEATADVYEMQPTDAATGAKPLVLFACVAPAYDLPTQAWPLRHVPDLSTVASQLRTGGGAVINRDLAALLNLADTNVYVQNAIREMYVGAGLERLFEHVREETIGVQYDVGMGYLKNASKKTRAIYEGLNIAAYAELPG